MALPIPALRLLPPFILSKANYVVSTNSYEAKLIAETRLIEAQAAKFEKEGAPQASLSRFGGGLMEFCKIAGALVLGFGGIATAVTGYQLTEAKKERLDAEIMKREAILADLERSLVGQKEKLDEQAAALKTATTEATAKATAIPSIDPAILNQFKGIQYKLDAAEKLKISDQLKFSKAMERLSSSLSK